MGDRPAKRNQTSEFERQAAEGRSGGPLGEFWYFLRRSGKWWMTPIILALLTIGALLVLSGTSIAPLIYAVF
jgi:hypothetical protein